ncbi:Adaptive-response sensory-kinase SasA [Austwickia sp. TVS 96-490-7B]|nr:Adaptive-response sensory-kinase SasA [Austwickia sp. TVS 96-490-7B]
MRRTPGKIQRIGRAQPHGIRHSGARRAVSIRIRLTLLTVIAVVIPLTIGMALATVLLHRSLVGSLRERTEVRAAEVSDVLTNHGVGGVQDRLHLLADEGRRVQIIDPAGAVVFSSAGAGANTPLSPLRPSPGQVEISGVEGWPLDVDDSPPVVVARGSTHGLSPYIVLVAAGRHVQDDAALRVARAAVVVVPTLLVGVAVVTWVLIGRTLRPVEAIRRTAQAITASNLAARVPEPVQTDEIAALAHTMNSMLDRLQAGHEAQRRFVADASHELRSPLASLRTAVQLAADPAMSTDLPEVLAVMDTESARLQRLVDDLLTLSKADDAGVVPVRFRDVDLDDVVAGEVRRLSVTGTVTVRSTLRPVRIRGDELHMSRVVRNLLDNAVRAATSTVTVTLTHVGTTAQIIIDDDGAGVPPDQRQRIFERFVRLDADRSRHTGGSGLGLSIVTEIVRAHGGSVRVEDAPGGGARFVVEVPAEPEPPTDDDQD